MFSEDKVIEIFYLADEFSNFFEFFDVQQEKSMLEVPQDGKRDRHKPNRMSDVEIIVNSYISTRANLKIVCTRFEKY